MAWKRPHSLVEDFPAVSVNGLHRAGIITRRDDLGGSQWGLAPDGDGSVSATYWIEEGRLDLHMKGAATARVGVEWTACRFGGERPYFTCPLCETRRARLHYVGDSWACRVCHDLRYKSQWQRLPDRRLDRAYRIRRDVLGQQGWVRAGDPWPERPKYMKTLRYLALCKQIEANEVAFLGHCHDTATNTLDWLRRTRERAEASKRGRGGGFRTSSLGSDA